MTRQFKLVNEKGLEYNLMDINNNCLLTSPSGLGYSYNTDYIQLGNTFIENIRNIEQGKIAGTLLFQTYDAVKAFGDYIENSEKLYFYYTIPLKDGIETYCKDIQLSTLSKTEKDTETGVLKCDIEFNCLTLWYKSSINYEQNQLIINHGHISAPIEVEIDGKVVNPHIQLYVEDTLFQDVVFNTTINEYEKLLYGSKENNFYINRQKTDGTLQSLEDLTIIDFNRDNVIRIPKNKNCKLKLIADTDINNSKILAYEYYKII